MKIQSQNLDQWCIKDMWPHQNQDQDAKPQSGTSSILQSPKSGVKGNGCSLHLQNQERQPKFRIWLYKRPVTISKSISGCQTQSGTSSNLQSPKSGLKGHGCFLQLQNQDREPQFGSWMYQRPVSLCKSRSRCQTPVRNIQHRQKLQSGLRGHGYSLHIQNSVRNLQYSQNQD